MPSRFDPLSDPESEPKLVPTHQPIDGQKRYDVYCTQQGSPLLVYSNMKLKGAIPLLAKDEGYSRIGDFVELEGADGQSVYVARFSIVSLCEHGKPFPGQIASIKTSGAGAPG